MIALRARVVDVNAVYAVNADVLDLLAVVEGAENILPGQQVNHASLLCAHFVGLGDNEADVELAAPVQPVEEGGKAASIRLVTAVLSTPIFTIVSSVLVGSTIAYITTVIPPLTIITSAIASAAITTTSITPITPEYSAITVMTAATTAFTVVFVLVVVVVVEVKVVQILFLYDGHREDQSELLAEMVPTHAH